MNQDDKDNERKKLIEQAQKLIRHQKGNIIPNPSNQDRSPKPYHKEDQSDRER